MFLSVVNIITILMLSLLVVSPVVNAEDRLYLTILHTNDEHSAVIPFNPALDYTPALGDDPTLGGFARLATQINSIKVTKALKGEPLLTLSAGDFLMGTMFSWLGKAGLAPELKLMTQMGYDAITLGNHEFDWGSKYLDSYLRAAGYPITGVFTPIVASNIIIPVGHPLRKMIKTHIVKDLFNGLKVGIFGILGYEAMLLSPNDLPVIFSDPRKTATRMVDALTELDVDLIICLSHSGVEEDREMAAKVAGIDVIIGGHSHDALFEPIIVGETIIVQAGKHGLYLGELELSVSQEGEVSIRNYDTGNPFLIPIDDSIRACPLMSKTIDQVYVKALNEMVSNLTGDMFDEILDVVAESEFDLLKNPECTESGLGNLITDSLRMSVDMFQNGDTVDFAFEASGSIRRSILRGNMSGNEEMISLYDVHSSVSLGIGLDGIPGYPMSSFYLTTEEIRRVCEISVKLSSLMGSDCFLQVSGLRITYNAGLKETFRAVTKLEQYVGPEPQSDGVFYETLFENGTWYVDPSTLYKVAANIYITYLTPFVAIVPKDQSGNRLPPKATIVHQTPGIELKIWHAVLQYVVSFPDIDADGIPDVPSFYATKMGRIIST